MKKILLAIGIFLFTAPVVEAQNQGKQQRMHERERLTPDRRAALQTQTMEQNLKLSSDQKMRLQQINLESARDLQPVIDQRREQNDRIRRINEQRINEYRKVLTPEQMNEYNKLRSREDTRTRQRPHK